MNNKKYKVIIILVVLCLSFIACESEMPLYMNYKNYGDMRPNAVMNYEPYLYNETDKFLELSQDEREKIQSLSEALINTFYNTNYAKIDNKTISRLEGVIDNGLYDLLTKEYYPVFLNESSFYSVVRIVKYAEIVPNNTIAGFHLDGKLMYKVNIRLLLRTYAAEQYFTIHPELEQGTTEVIIWLYIDTTNWVIEEWVDNYVKDDRVFQTIYQNRE